MEGTPNGVNTQADPLAQAGSSVSYGAVNPNAATLDQRKLLPVRLMPDGSEAFTEVNVQGQQLLATRLATAGLQTIFTAKQRYTDMSVVCANLDNAAVQPLLLYVVPSGGSAGTSNAVIPGTSIPILAPAVVFDFGMNPGDTIQANVTVNKFSFIVTGKLLK